MIVDTHVHLGQRGIFRLEPETLLAQMDENHIDIGIVSSVNCIEYEPDRPVPVMPKTDQLGENRALLRQCRESGGRLYLSFWCAPAMESAHGVFEFLRDNRDTAVGMKLHPFYSRLPLGDTRYEPYLQIARQLKLPVSVHTAPDEFSNPRQLLAMAKRYPDVNFIMVHMGLGSDNSEAIDCLRLADNLYGDTTWVPYEKVCRAIKVCGREKLLFGSDAPIDGKQSYAFYQRMLRQYRRDPDGVWGDLMQRNAQRLFAL